MIKQNVSAKNFKNIFFNTCFDKNYLKNLIAWILDLYGEKKTLDFLEKLKQVGFHEATQAGVSLGLEDLQIPGKKALLVGNSTLETIRVNTKNLKGSITGVEKSQQMIDLWNQLSNHLRQNAVENLSNTNPVNSIYMMAFSGARGNISQVRQLVAMRGLMADPQGLIVEFPIRSNFREGLTITEYLISCYGARKGLVDTALRTATSGYLTRRLVDAAQHVVITISDCQTSKGIYLKKNLELRLVGRVLGENLLLEQKQIFKKNQLISSKVAKLIAARYDKVFVRSPLTCENHQSICQLCYGIDLAKGCLVHIGEAVGIIAAQSIGEPGTQLTMRTFHTGGVGVFSEQATKSIYSPFRGKVEFPEALTGHFIRTPQGHIVYMVKNVRLNPTRIVLKILPLDLPQKIFVVQEQELPAGSILFIRQHQVVKAGQLVAQASQLQKSKQTMPESTHLVESTIAGEVYLKKKKIKPLDGVDNFSEHPVMVPPKLGTLWIFSLFNQIESNLGKSFIQKGDLISTESFLISFKFKANLKLKLHKVENNLLIGRSITQLSVKSIKFLKIGYFLNIKKKISHKKYNHLLLERQNKKYDKIDIFKNYSVPRLLYIKKFIQPQEQSLIWLPFQLVSTSNNLKFFLKKEQKLNNISYATRQKNYSFIDYFTASNSKKIKTFNSFERQNRIKNFSNPFFLFATQNSKLKIGPKNPSFYFLYNQLFFQSLQDSSRNFKLGLQKVRKNKNFLITKSKINKFLLQILNKNSNSIFQNSNVQFVLKSAIEWLYIPFKLTHKNFGNSQKFIFLEEGKKFENLLFSSCNVNLKFFDQSFIKILDQAKKQTHSLKSQNFGYLRNELLQKACVQIKKAFSKTPIISQNIPYIDDQKIILGQRTLFLKKLKFNCTMNYRLSQNITFYTQNEKFNFEQKKKSKTVKQSKRKIKKKSRIVRQPKLKIKKKSKTVKQSKLKMNLSSSTNFILILKLNEQLFLNNSELKTRWVALQHFNSIFDIHSPLYCKQISTSFSDQDELSIDFQSINPSSSRWDINQQNFQVNLHFQKNLQFPYTKTELKSFNLNHSYQSFNFCFNLMFYDFLLFHAYQNVKISTLSKNLIAPQEIFTDGSVKIKTAGEFRRFHNLENYSISSILAFNDLKTFHLFSSFNNSKKFTIGQAIRWGEEINPNKISTINGRIIALKDNKLIIQQGTPFLVSTGGILHVQHKDLIQKKNLLMTLKFRRLQTEDIVQGIPKIEQLFEARETQDGEIMKNNIHLLLRKLFINGYRQVFPPNIEYAVSKSVSTIQRFLIQNILEAYSNQGVNISEKHVEIIVKQMTIRGRILNSGDTGLVQGEIIYLTVIQKINKKLKALNLKEAKYEPLVLGISKSVIESESFLLAASFQEVSRVLVRSALSRKTDFLRGLHENAMLGQLIPAGTGLLTDIL